MAQREIEMKQTLDDAIDVARSFAPLERISAVVLEEDSPWWSGPLSRLHSSNVAIEPIDRGSAASVALALLRVAARHPRFSVVFLCLGAFCLSDLVHASDALERIERGSASELVIVRDPSSNICVASAKAALELLHAAQPMLLRFLSENAPGTLLFDTDALSSVYPYLPFLEFEQDVISA